MSSFFVSVNVFWLQVVDIGKKWVLIVLSKNILFFVENEVVYGIEGNCEFSFKKGRSEVGFRYSGGSS